MSEFRVLIDEITILVSAHNHASYVTSVLNDVAIIVRLQQLAVHLYNKIMTSW
jgi:hypothetical protein